MEIFDKIIINWRFVGSLNFMFHMILYREMMYSNNWII